MNTMKTLNQLNDELRHSIGGFQRYMNRPLARVHVYTWRLAVSMEPVHAPNEAGTIRYLPAFRSLACRQWRKAVANALREQRGRFGRSWWVRR